MGGGQWVPPYLVKKNIFLNHCKLTVFYINYIIAVYKASKHEIATLSESEFERISTLDSDKKGSDGFLEARLENLAGSPFNERDF